MTTFVKDRQSKISDAMPSARFQFTQDLTRQMGAVLGIVRLLNSSRRLEEQLVFLLAEIMRVLEAEHCVFHLINEKNEELCTHFLQHGELQRNNRPIGTDIAAYVIKSGKIVNVADTCTDRRFVGQLVKFNGLLVRSFLVVPICNMNGRITGCLQVINKMGGDGFDQKDSSCLLIMADFIALAIQNSLNQNKALASDILEKEIAHAVDIQRKLLPSKVPQLPGYDMFAFNQPCQYVGGDYYDFFPFPRTMGLVLADVSGHGVPAALLTANLHASLHAHSNESDACQEIVKRVNNHFHLYTGNNMFATIFMGKLNHDTHRLRYVNAGHVPPALIRKDGSLTTLKSGGLPIGIVESFSYEEAEVKLFPGDTMVMFSDGLTELMSSTGQQFGRDRLVETLRQYHHLQPKEMGKIVLKTIRSFAASPAPPDDMTLMILKRDLN